MLMKICKTYHEHPKNKFLIVTESAKSKLLKTMPLLKVRILTSRVVIREDLMRAQTPPKGIDLGWADVVVLYGGQKKANPFKLSSILNFAHHMLEVYGIMSYPQQKQLIQDGRYW